MAEQLTPLGHAQGTVVEALSEELSQIRTCMKLPKGVTYCARPTDRCSRDFWSRCHPVSQVSIQKKKSCPATPRYPKPSPRLIIDIICSRHCWTFRARLLSCCMVLDGLTQLQTNVAQKTKHTGKQNHGAGRQTNLSILTTWKLLKIITGFVSTTLLSITIWESVHVNRATYFKSILSSPSETTEHILKNQKLQQEKLVS